MSNEYPKKWIHDPQADTLILETVSPDDLQASALAHSTKPDSDETEVEKTLELPLVNSLDAIYDKSEKPPTLEMLRELTEHEEPRTPLGVRLATAALSGVVFLGDTFWQQSPWGIREKMDRIRSGDFLPSPPTIRNAVLGLGCAALAAGIAVVGVHLADSEQDHAARAPQTATSHVPPNRQEPAPIMPSEHSQEIPEFALPSPTGLPSGQDGGISIPHPPVTRAPIGKATPQQPRFTAAPPRPQQEANPAIAQPAPKQTTVEARETPSSTSAPSRSPGSTPRPEQPNTTPPTTKPPATPPVQPPKTTSTPTASESSPTSKPTTSATQSQNAPSPTNTKQPPTSEVSHTTITVRPSSNTTNSSRGTTIQPSPKQTTSASPRNSFSATSIPTAATLKPTSKNPNE